MISKIQLVLVCRWQEALSRGFDPDRIRKAFRKKWEETGMGFNGSQHLFEALFRGAGHDEGAADDVGPSSQSTSSQVSLMRRA